MQEIAKWLLTSPPLWPPWFNGATRLQIALEITIAMCFLAALVYGVAKELKGGWACPTDDLIITPKEVHKDVEKRRKCVRDVH